MISANSDLWYLVILLIPIVAIPSTFFTQKLMDIIDNSILLMLIVYLIACLVAAIIILPFLLL